MPHAIFEISCSFALTKNGTNASRILLNKCKHIVRAKAMAWLVAMFQLGLLIFTMCCAPFWVQGQTPEQYDSLAPAARDTSLQERSDSAKIMQETDSLAFNLANHKSDLTTNVAYEADDSIILDLPNKKAYLYGNAKIFYEEIKLNAHYIVIDFDNKDVFATGILDDTTGKYTGRPTFEDAGKIYEADTMVYNFDSKKGISYGVLTTEKDGFIHGKRVLRDSLEHIYVKDARFTTCNLPKPHFYISADKIKVIPRKQIITGPANLVIAEINTPLVVPFGFFPIPEKRKHGIIFPQFGESQQQGFNVRGLGYYFPISDYFDLQIGADIYSRGSWAGNLQSNYFRKYRYSGNLSFRYSNFKIGEPLSSSYSETQDYDLRWTYRRDNKAKPGTSFGANVRFLTSSSLKNNTTNYEDLVRTNSNSSINWGKSFFNNKLNIGVVSNMDQNLTTGKLNLTLPQLTANFGRQMPFKTFKSKNQTLKSFLNNLGISYQSTFKNEITTGDSILVSGVGEIFGRPTLSTPSNLRDDFRSGMSHVIPIATSFKALKWLTISPGFSFNEFWNFQTTNRLYDSELDTLFVRNIGGFERAYNYSTSIGISTILYGIKTFKKQSKLQAIRHVVRPNFSAVWNPDFERLEESRKRQYIDQNLELINYNILDNQLMARPIRGKQASLNFGIGNNIEIKVLSAKDTANGGVKKVKIIENFNITSGYNFLADSFQLADFRMSGNTTILNKIRITFGTTFDPYTYQLDSTGKREFRRRTFALEGMNQLGNFKGSNLSISTNLNPQAFERKKSEAANEAELEFINNNMQNYVDFNLPWSLNINYNFRTGNTVLVEGMITQSITFDGDIKLSENWKVGINSGYNITAKEIALTSINLFRDLHCWQMNFEWFPIGRQMFSFGINVKSSTLQDLKLNRRRSWFDF